MGLGILIIGLIAIGIILGFFILRSMRKGIIWAIIAIILVTSVSIISPLFSKENSDTNLSKSVIQPLKTSFILVSETSRKIISLGKGTVSTIGNVIKEINKTTENFIP